MHCWWAHAQLHSHPMAWLEKYIIKKSVNSLPVGHIKVRHSQWNHKLTHERKIWNYENFFKLIHVSMNPNCPIKLNGSTIYLPSQVMQSSMGVFLSLSCSHFLWVWVNEGPLPTRRGREGVCIIVIISNVHDDVCSWMPSVICDHAKSLEHCHNTFMKSNNPLNPFKIMKKQNKKNKNPNFLFYSFLYEMGESIFSAKSKIAI